MDATRRAFLTGAAALPALVSPVLSTASVQGSLPLPADFVQQPPDLLIAYVGDADASRAPLSRAGVAWTGSGAAAGVRVVLQPGAAGTAITLESADVPVQRVHLRWKRPIAAGTLVLGDAWERSYGDLAWRHLEPERTLPWYAVLSLGGAATGFGVKTGAGAFAFWQVDTDGISLWLDVRNGGNGVQLGSRVLAVATLVAVSGEAGESAFAVTRRLCRAMAAGTRVPARRGSMPVSTVLGSNDWYYAYGQNTPAGLLRDADLVASVAPAGGPKPFTVVDDGYQDPARFPSMPRLAEDIRGRGVLPGLWIRPLRAAANTPANLLLPAARRPGRPAEECLAFDPTIPEALERVTAVAAEAAAWGYDLIKHDFTTWELFGQWGSQIGASPTVGRWHFNDRSRTNAEIVTGLYGALRGACGPDQLILGCNTVGHLSVGLFDASRTGDDVSGREWERTRRLGVNTLAFRLPQHGAFFSVDADCVPLTPDVPWTMTRQWLDVVARSGTVLLVSPDPRSVGAEQRAALREAFALAAGPTTTEPLDWQQAGAPAVWRGYAYDWILPEGQSPFPIGIQRGQE